MIRKLIQMAFVGCIAIAATVPAEAGLFDRIRSRHCGKQVGCCQPQTTCAPAPCAPAACAPCGKVPSCPCYSEPSCIQQYHDNIAVCSRLFGNNPALCEDCCRQTVLAYQQCMNSPGTNRMAYKMNFQKPTCPPQPHDPTIEACYEARLECEMAGDSPNCAYCYLECLKLIPSVRPPMDTR